MCAQNIFIDPLTGGPVVGVNPAASLFQTVEIVALLNPEWVPEEAVSQGAQGLEAYGKRVEGERSEYARGSSRPQCGRGLEGSRRVAPERRRCHFAAHNVDGSFVGPRGAPLRACKGNGLSTMERHRETHGTRALLSATKLTIEQGGLRARRQGTRNSSGNHRDRGGVG